MEKSIESEKSDFLIVLKKALRNETISEDFRRICEKAIDIIEGKKPKDI